jgi:hypothetical protein
VRYGGGRGDGRALDAMPISQAGLEVLAEVYY